MSIYKDIPAIPTKYKGRIFRSRLEARVACFFDRKNVVYEYEPLDLGVWSPDFLVHTEDYHVPSLVEVKPLQNSFDMVKILSCINFKKYAITLMTPFEIMAIKHDGIRYYHLSDDPDWISAGNEVRYLKNNN